jgi:hypothetical protein
MKKKQDEPLTLRIVTQYRARRGMVYELESEGATLNVHVAPRATPVDAGEWAVEARNSRAADAVAIVAWGATRTDALAAVGRDWQLNDTLHPFDWNAVRTLLTTVGALGGSHETR